MRKSKILFKGLSFSYVEYIIGIAAPIITMPIALGYFGVELYGLWLVVNSFIVFLQFTDLGINLSSQNEISFSSEIHKQAEIIKKSFLILFGISTIILVLVWCLHMFSDDWAYVIGIIPEGMYNQIENIILVMIVYFAITFPLKLSMSIFKALQQMHWASIYQVVIRIISIFALIITIVFKYDLFVYAVLICTGQIIVTVVSTVHLWYSNRQLFREVFNGQSGKVKYADLLSNGFKFFNMSVSTLIILNAGNIIINHSLGPAYVTPFAISFRLFYMGIQLTNSIGVVLWPMYAKAKGIADWSWINSTYKSSMIIHTRLGAMLFLGGILFAEPIIDIWVGPELFPGFVFIYCIGAWSYMTSYAGGVLSLLNAIGPTIVQVGIQWFYAIIYIGLSLLMIDKYGINAVAFALFIGVTLNYISLPYTYVKARTKGHVYYNLSNIVLHFVIILVPSVILSEIIRRSLSSLQYLITAIGLFIIFVLVSLISVPKAQKALILGTIRNMRQS